MKTATIREVQHQLKYLLHWVEDGETVTVTRNHQVVAQIVPPPPPKALKLKWPDLTRRIRERYPHKPLTKEQTSRFWQEARGDR